MKEELKTRPDFEKLAIAACGETDLSMRLSVTMGVSRWPKVREVQRAMENLFTTHVEPLQAENVKLKEENKTIYEQGYAAGRNGLHNSDLQSENQKLREALKDCIQTIKETGQDFDCLTACGYENLAKYNELLKLDKTNP